LPGVGVDGDDGLLGRGGQALVGGDEGVGERVEQDLGGDPLVAGDLVEGFEEGVVVFHGAAALWWRVWVLPGLGAGAQSKAVVAPSMSAKAMAPPSAAAPSSVTASRRPLTRGGGSAAGTSFTATVEPTDRRKCSGVRSLRSRPGLETSRT